MKNTNKFILSCVAISVLLTAHDSFAGSREKRISLEWEDFVGLYNLQGQIVDQVCPVASWKMHAMIVAETLPFVSAIISANEDPSQLELREKLTLKRDDDLFLQDLEGSILSSAKEILINGRMPDPVIQYSDAYVYRQQAERDPVACAAARKKYDRLKQISDQFTNNIRAKNLQYQDLDWEAVKFPLPAWASQSVDKEMEAVLQATPRDLARAAENAK